MPTMVLERDPIVHRLDHSFTDELTKVAADQAEKEQSQRPLVLLGLKTKIQLQRLKHGLGELVVEEEEPKVYLLTEEEKRKQQKRKERNKQAAKNSRNKKKSQHSMLQMENTALKERNKHLRQKVKQLRYLMGAYQTSIKSSRICYDTYALRLNPPNVMRHTAPHPTPSHPAITAFSHRGLSPMDVDCSLGHNTPAPWVPVALREEVVVTAGSPPVPQDKTTVYGDESLTELLQETPSIFHTLGMGDDSGLREETHGEKQSAGLSPLSQERGVLGRAMSLDKNLELVGIPSRLSSLRADGLVPVTCIQRGI